MIPNKPVMTEKEKNQAMEQFIHGGERKAAEENIGLAEYYINAIIEANEKRKSND